MYLIIFKNLSVSVWSLIIWSERRDMKHLLMQFHNCAETTSLFSSCWLTALPNNPNLVILNQRISLKTVIDCPTVLKVLSWMCWQMELIHNLLWPDCTVRGKHTHTECGNTQISTRTSLNTKLWGGTQHALSLIRWWHETDAAKEEKKISAIKESYLLTSATFSHNMRVNSAEYCQAINLVN